MKEASTRVCRSHHMANPRKRAGTATRRPVWSLQQLLSDIHPGVVWCLRWVTPPLLQH